MRGELLERRLGRSDHGPEIGGPTQRNESVARKRKRRNNDEQESIGSGDGGVGSLDEVTHGGGVSSSLSVDILDTGQLQHSLTGGGGDDTGSSGSGDDLNVDGSDLSVDLAGNGVGLSELGSPVTSSNGDDGELGEDDGTSNGGSDLLGALDSQSDVSVEISNRDESLESSSLSGASLLLDGHDLHDLICACRQSQRARASREGERTLELGAKDVDDLVLFDGEGEEVDLLDGLDLSVLYESSELGNGNPERNHESSIIDSVVCMAIPAFLQSPAHPLQS